MTLHDIAFEGRNKEYGAYELLAGKERRLRSGLIISVVSFLLINMLLAVTVHLSNKENEIFTIPPVSVGLDNKLPSVFSSGLSNGLHIQVKNEIKVPEKLPVDVEKVANIRPEVNEKTIPGSSASQGKSDLSTENSQNGVPWGSEEVFLSADVIPQFMGGREALAEYLSKNVHYPADAIDRLKQGTVLVCFVVTSTGKVKDVKIVRSVDPLLDREAMRVVSEMPDWKPGLRGGTPVNIVMTIPIRFDLKLHFSSHE